MRLLICGDRNWRDRQAVRRILERYMPEVLIEGEANGADNTARECARDLGIEVMKFPANWSRYGRSAGPKRNSEMLELGKPDLVIGFHNDISSSKGTKDMLLKAKQAGIKTLLYQQGHLEEFSGIA